MRAILLLFWMILISGCAATSVESHANGTRASLSPELDNLTRSEMLSEILHSSGFTAQVANLSQVGTLWNRRLQIEISNRMDEDDHELCEQILVWSRTSASPEFAAAKLLDDAREQLQTLSLEDLKHILAFYRSESWNQYSLFVAKMRSQVGQQQMARELAKMRGRKEDPEIKLKRTQLARVASELELLMIFSWDASAHYARTMEHLLPNHLEGSDTHRESLRQSFLSNAKRRSDLRSRYIFTRLSEEILDDHLVFFQSIAGQRLAKKRKEAMQHALASAEKRATLRVMEAFSAWEKELESIQETEPSL
jgi:hypothetical protein